MKKLLEVQPKKIAIFRALQLGDLLCSIPAIRSIKRSLPDSDITLIGLPWAATFVERFPQYFSDFISFPGYPGLPETPFEPLSFIEFLVQMNKQEFDLVIQMHGNGSLINPMMEMFGSKISAGFFESGRYCPNKDYYMAYPEGIPEIHRHLQLAEFLGLTFSGVEMEFPIKETDIQKFLKLSYTHQLKPKKYCCVHSGARDIKRWWGAEKFAEVANYIANKGYTIVLTGTQIEEDTVKKVEQCIIHPVINLVGQTDLGTLAVLIKNSAMLFSNDTGVSHISAALETPSVVVFLVSDPVRWAPLNRSLHRIILPQEAENVSYVIDNVEGILQKEVIEV